MEERLRRELTPGDSKYPLPASECVMRITPEMASDWMSTRRAAWNRAIIPAGVEDLVAEIRAGAFTVTHQGIAFTVETRDERGRWISGGYILDGQHRLCAVANAGIPVDMRIFPAEERAQFDRIDSGRKRTAGGLLRGVPNQYGVAGAARFLAVASGDYPPRSKGGAWASLNTRQTVEYVAKWPELGELSPWATSLVKGPARLPLAPSMALMAQIQRTEYAELLEKVWVRPLASGAIGTDAGDARLRLLRMFSGSHRASITSNRSKAYAVMVKAWNVHVQGGKRSVLAWKDGEPVPKVIGYKP